MKRSPADVAFSKCIRAAADYKCQRCGKQYDSSSTGLHCSHNFGRRHRTIRWCVDNALSLCAACHAWYGENPADSGKWLEEFIGEGTVDLLREKMRMKYKISKDDEKEIAKHYREQLKRIDQGLELESYQ